MHDFKTHIIDTAQALNVFINYVYENEFEYMVLDLETNSKEEKLAKVWGIGICFDNSEAFYIPMKTEDGKRYWYGTEYDNVLFSIREWSKTYKLIGHNILYDVLVWENNYGEDLSPYIYSDTILLKHAIDEERPFALKDISVKYLGDWADNAQKELEDAVLAAGGRWTKEEKDMYLAPTEVLGKYCCWDVMLTLLLFHKFNPLLEREGLSELFYEEETMPLYREVTIPMKRRGFNISIEHFERLLKDISRDIEMLEHKIMEALGDIPEIEKFQHELLDKEVSASKSANALFPKRYAERIGIELPINAKTGKPSLARKGLEKLTLTEPRHVEFINWLMGDNADPSSLSQQFGVRLEIFFERKPEQNYVFNLGSKMHLRYLFFDVLNEKPISFTESGLPCTDNTFLESIANIYIWVADLIDYNKLKKLKGTYIEGILDRQLDGIIYTSMLQYGTTSGRYSSTNPNLQNLPRPKEEDSGISELVLRYVNAIREGFVAGSGNKIIDADYSALEPRCFADAANDPKLLKVFREGEDLYSSIAINVFNVEGVSAMPEDDNYLKKVKPELRQKAKVFALAVVYGAGAGQIAKSMKIKYKEAEEIIKMYLDAYPGLKDYMETCDTMVLHDGYVTTRFGRKRHLSKAATLYQDYSPSLLDRRWSVKRGLEQEWYQLKNMRNLAKNHPIQGLAAHIVNRAAININRQFKEKGIMAVANGEKVPAYVGLQIHDQLACVACEEQADEAAKIVQDVMENTTKISIPLPAEPMIADNLRDSH